MAYGFSFDEKTFGVIISKETFYCRAAHDEPDFLCKDFKLVKMNEFVVRQLMATPVK